jgi:hypothetical protein
MTYRPNYLLVDIVHKMPDVISIADTVPEVRFDRRTRIMIERGLDKNPNYAIYELQEGM